MTDKTPKDLPDVWRRHAESLAKYAPAAATAFEQAAGDLEAALKSEADALLTLEEAHRVSGYTADSLGRMIREGRLTNHGRKHAPKVRRGDLPMKPTHAPEPRIAPSTIVADVMAKAGRGRRAG